MIIGITISLWNFRIYQVDGQSMEPTLRDNQYVLVCRVCHVEKNDVAVFTNPDGKLTIKRIFATKKDQVKISDSKLMLNNVLTELPIENLITNNGDYYMIGDNYLNSVDSRKYGWINQENIVGRVILN